MKVNMTTWGIERLKSVDPIAVNNFCQSTQSCDGPSLRSQGKMADSSLMKGVLDLADERLRKFNADKQMVQCQLHVAVFTSVGLLCPDFVSTLLGPPPPLCFVSWIFPGLNVQTAWPVFAAFCDMIQPPYVDVFLLLLG
jgi:hypothetical protein